jgi:two-component system sensor histidine kinase KdpD
MALHNRIMVRVIDRGPGIPSAQQERVFEPFYRAGTDRTGHRGSGLGLAIVRGFVEANGGRVWVESLPNQGTTFALELPLDQPTDAGAPAGTPAPAGTRS